MEINRQNSKRLSIKVDLTPMVDLGFLLITFFMLATSFSKPKTMEVLKPDDKGSFDYPQSKTTTILMGPRDKAYCYSLPDKLESWDDLRYDSVSYDSKGLRKYILQRQSEVKARYGSSDDLFLIIKPLDQSHLEYLVNVLDEIVITNVKHYAIVNEKTVADSVIMGKMGR